MSIPGWFTFLLLALASYRTWRLLAEDDILNPLRNRLLRMENPDWEDAPGKDWTGESYRAGLGAFIGCPWCLGFWVVLAWWGAWQVWEFGTEVAAVPMALSALVPLIERVTSTD